MPHPAYLFLGRTEGRAWCGVGERPVMKKWHEVTREEKDLILGTLELTLECITGGLIGGTWKCKPLERWAREQWGAKQRDETSLKKEKDLLHL